MHLFSTRDETLLVNSQFYALESLQRRVSALGHGTSQTTSKIARSERLGRRTMQNNFQRGTVVVLVI
ncbi:hypothetical protein NL337_26780, partial [Klebsiella pneumoniae]|nr:hypothetical protein [Klebsiella pneumoniae]